MKCMAAGTAAVLTGMLCLGTNTAPVPERIAVIAEADTEPEPTTEPTTTPVKTVTFGQCGDNLIYKLTDDGMISITGAGDMEDFRSMTSVPWHRQRDSITALQLDERTTSIGKWAFCFTGLETVRIPESVTSIGQQAFSECTKLERVTIPPSVTSIGVDAFSGCPNLTIYGADDSYAQQYAQEYGIPFVGTNAAPIVDSGTCGENVTWTLDENGKLVISGTGKMMDYDYSKSDSPFFDNNAIRKIVINPSVTSIGGDAFYCCSSLTSVTIPDGVTSIGDGAFGDCARLTSVTIPDSMTSIGYGAFSYCESLTSITIPDSVTFFDMYIFDKCENLTIYGTSGSYAESYAKSFNIPFVAIGSPAPTEPVPQVEPYAPGDVTGDSVINAKDATAILKYAAAVGNGESGDITKYL